MAKCRSCKAPIQFVMKEGKWIVVNPYTISPIEAESRRKKIPIPFDPNIHQRHICANKPKQDYEGVYRG